ncbi:MAG: hypothetical protein WA194_07855 [Patescibacteria group bacterium]
MAVRTAFPDFSRFDGTSASALSKIVKRGVPNPTLSKTERLREIWQKTAKVRIGVGFALMA